MCGGCKGDFNNKRKVIVYKVFYKVFNFFLQVSPLLVRSNIAEVIKWTVTSEDYHPPLD